MFELLKTELQFGGGVTPQNSETSTPRLLESLENADQNGAMVPFTSAENHFVVLFVNTVRDVR